MPWPGPALRCAGPGARFSPLLRPSWKTATATPTAPSPISTHTHQATLLADLFPLGAVWVLVTTVVVLFLIEVVCPGWVTVLVSVVVFGGAVIVVDTVVVTVVSVVLVELVVCAAAIPATPHANTAPASSATDARTNSLKAATFIEVSVAGSTPADNTANMRDRGRRTPRFPAGLDGHPRG